VNFLVHMLLSGEDEQLLVGNFMGDFVKGRLYDRFPERIRQGVELHRRIDSFASQNIFFNCSRQRISPDYGLYRGVLVDLFYDHLLAANWHEWTAEPFEHFLQRARLAADRQLSFIPPAMQQLLPVIFTELLPSYKSVEGIAAALGRMSRRVRRPNPLSSGAVELVNHRDGLAADFRQFMAEISEFTAPLLTRPERNFSVD